MAARTALAFLLPRRTAKPNDGAEVTEDLVEILRQRRNQLADLRALAIASDQVQYNDQGWPTAACAGSYPRGHPPATCATGSRMRTSAAITERKRLHWSLQSWGEQAKSGSPPLPRPEIVLSTRAR